MTTLHAVLRGDAALRTQVRGYLNRHGWVSGRRPESDAERSSSLDWRGGGNREFPVRLAAAADPTGPVVAYGLNGWTTDRSGSARQDLFVSLISANGVETRQLGTQRAMTPMVWWNGSQASFDAGIAQLGLAIKVTL